MKTKYSHATRYAIAAVLLAQSFSVQADGLISAIPDRLQALSAVTAQIPKIDQANVPQLFAVPSFRTSALDIKPPKFELGVHLPEVPATLPLLATYVPDKPLEYLQDIAERLEMNKKIVRNGNDKVAVRIDADTDDQRTLTGFEASGGFFYRYDRKLHAIPEQQPDLPSPERAFELATKHLHARGLIPDDALVDPRKVHYHYPTLTQFNAETGKSIRTFRTGIEVRYPQHWEGIPVTGPGSKLYVALGDGGSLLGITHMRRQAIPSGETLPTVDPEKALASLKPGAHLSIPVGCSIATIDSFRLAYWSRSPKQTQRIAMPLYQIAGRCETEHGESLGEFEGYAPAVYAQNFKLNDDPADFDEDDAEQR